MQEEQADDRAIKTLSSSSPRINTRIARSMICVHSTFSTQKQHNDYALQILLSQESVLSIAAQ